ncbi:MAG: hypothetical protein QXX94_00045 [Candidatus Bathyarchaeia archaeon]
MRESCVSAVLSMIILLSLITASIHTIAMMPKLMVVEWSIERVNNEVTLNAIPPEDDSMSNPDYKLLPFKWKTTAKFWINPSNKYGFLASAVVAAITASANTWDSQITFKVFEYRGTTRRNAGRYDGYNVVSWGSYRAGVIAVTYIWYVGDMIIETDTRLNTYYEWSLKGEPNKMDVQNIMTHEFGHWCGLDDLYEDKDYWLTMYGYADYGETYKQTLGLGDILGLQAVYSNNK